MNLICADCHRIPDDCVCEEVKAEHEKYSRDALNLCHFFLEGLTTDMMVVRAGRARDTHPDISDEDTMNALRHLIWHIEKIIGEPIPDVRF